MEKCYDACYGDLRNSNKVTNRTENFMDELCGVMSNMKIF